MTTKTAAARPQSAGARRRFLKTATATAATAGTLGFPMIAKAQTGPISMRWQSTWPAKDIFHEYANDFAKKRVRKPGLLLAALRAVTESA